MMACEPACRTYLSGMRDTWTRLIVGSMVVLSACAATPDAGQQFDGAYVGTGTLTRGTADWCGSVAAPASGTIRDGRFTYASSVPYVIQPVVVLSQVHSDGAFSGGSEYFEPNPGTFSGHVNEVTMVGHVAGTMLDAQVESLRCGYHLSLQRN
jgi:hypothetical protein